MKRLFVDEKPSEMSLNQSIVYGTVQMLDN